MAELEKLLENLLENPDTVGKLKSMITGEVSKESKGETAYALDSIDPDMLVKLTRAMSAMSSAKEDSRSRLLCDLKPYISEGRCKRVDEAVQILKLIKVIDIMGKE